jgi:hypothetical protein
MRSVRLERTRPYLLVLAVLLACAGQVVLVKTTAEMPNEGERQILAGILLIAGGLLFGWLAMRDQVPLPRFEFPRGGIGRPVAFWRSLWMRGLPWPAMILAIVGIVLFAKDGESPTVVIIWLVGILALVVAQLAHVQFSRPHIAPGERLYLVGLGVLIVVALITRAYKLTTLPYNLDGDFASVGLQARAIATDPAPDIFTYGWAAIPILGYFPAALTMRLFGTGLAGLSASGVIEGILIIIGVYLLGRDLFQPRVGLMAAALLTVSYTDLAATRQAIYIDPVFFLVYAIYFLLLGLREGRGWAIVASGILTGLCLEMYYSGRIVVFIIGFIFLFLLIFRPPWLLTRGWAVLLWTIAVFVTLGPMLIVFIRHPVDFMSRTRDVFILSPAIVKHMEGVYQVDSIPALLLQQARRTLLMFHYYPDKGTQFGFRRPLLDPVTDVFFTLGIGYALFQMRRFGNLLALAWLAIGMLIGCFLTKDPPFWTRLMILLPPAALLPALSLNFLYERAKAGLGRFGRRPALIASATAVLLIAAMGMLNWKTYVNIAGTYATARTRIARYLAAEPAGARAYLVSNPYYSYNDREFDFFVPGRLVANLPQDQVNASIPRIGSPTLLILISEQAALVQQLQQIYPKGSAQTLPGNSPGEVGFYTFRLP